MLLKAPMNLCGYYIYKNIKEAKRTPVYKAIKNGEKFVLKFSSNEMIKHEYAIMAQMSHKNVLKANEIIIKDGIYGYAMPYAKGKTLYIYLNEYVKQGRIIPEIKVQSIMKQIFSGLFYIHSLGLVHRDIKLENIYFMDENYSDIVLADFEFTKHLNNNDSIDFLGTNPYKAPEYLNEDRTYSNKIDCWSAGIIMYFLLFNTYPFYKPNYQVDEEEYWDEEKIINCSFQFGNIQRSKYAKHLIKKLLCADPQKRYSAEKALNHPWFSEITGNSNVRFEKSN